MANQKLTLEHERLILSLAGQGKTQMQIVEELRAKGLQVNQSAVSRFLTKSKKQRSEIAKVIVRERLASGLTVDLDRLELEASRLARIAKKLGSKIEKDEQKPSENLRYLRVLDRLHKFTNLKLHYSGADTPDTEPHDAGAVDRVLAKLASMLDPTPPADPTTEAPTPPTIQ